MVIDKFALSSGKAGSELLDHDNSNLLKLVDAASEHARPHTLQTLQDFFVRRRCG